MKQCEHVIQCIDDLITHGFFKLPPGKVTSKYTCGYIGAGTVKHCRKRRLYAGEIVENSGEEGSQDVRDAEKPSGGT